jgi:Bifunctional DNA primase/polymerase, N-terminal
MPRHQLTGRAVLRSAPECPSRAGVALPRRQAMLLAAALGAARRGWYVFPLRPNDKRPATPTHSETDCDRSDRWCRDGHRGWEARATTDERRIRRAWLQAPFNIGIACGPSGLLVLDLDVVKDATQAPEPWRSRGTRTGREVLAQLALGVGEPVPTTHAVQTGRGGAHLCYRQPAGARLGNTAGLLGWLIDTRGYGGYVVAAGSIVAGHPYLTTNHSDPVPLPTWLTTRLTPPPVAAPTAPQIIGTGRQAAYLYAALTAEVDRVRSALEGTRNHTLYRAAAALGQLVAGGCLTDVGVTAHLTQAALVAGLTATETARTIASGLCAGAQHPRTPIGEPDS